MAILLAPTIGQIAAGFSELFFEARFTSAGEATSTLYSLFVSWRDYNLVVADGPSIIQTQANPLT